jgi:hypothetical protein
MWHEFGKISNVSVQPVDGTKSGSNVITTTALPITELTNGFFCQFDVSLQGVGLHNKKK